MSKNQRQAAQHPNDHKKPADHHQKVSTPAHQPDKANPKVLNIETEAEPEAPKEGWDLKAKELVLHCTQSFSIVTSIILDMAGEAIHHGEKRIELMAK